MDAVASLLFAISAKLAAPVYAGPTLIIVPVNPPACWYDPTYARAPGLSDLDLIANSYDAVFPVRDASEPAGSISPGSVVVPSSPPPSNTTTTNTTTSVVGPVNGTVVIINNTTDTPTADPGTFIVTNTTTTTVSTTVTPNVSGFGTAMLPSPSWCIVSNGKFGFYQFDLSGTHLMRFTNCTDSSCSAGCILADTVAYPPEPVTNISRSALCSPSFYQIANATNPTPILINPGLPTRFFRRDIFSNAGIASNCSGTPRIANLIRVYDTCTLVTDKNASLPYALTTMSSDGTTMTQRLCQDSMCSLCAASSMVAPWSISNTCIVTKDATVRGLYNPVTTVSGTSVPAGNFTPTAGILVALIAICFILFGLLVLLIWYLVSISLRVNQGKRLAFGKTNSISSTAGLSAVVLPPRTSYPPSRGILAGLGNGQQPMGPGSRASILIMPSAAIGQGSGSTIALGSAAPNARNSLMSIPEGSAANTLNASRIVHLMEQPHVVVVDYEPQMTDELKLTVGDQIILESIWSDGWAQGFNITTGERGTLAIATLDTITARAAAAAAANTPAAAVVGTAPISPSPPSANSNTGAQVNVTASSDGDRAAPGGWFRTAASETINSRNDGTLTRPGDRPSSVLTQLTIVPDASNRQGQQRSPVINDQTPQLNL